MFYRITHWETWDWRLKYIPLVPSWIWYCLRSKSFWYFTPSNPGLIFGGMDGVSKKQMYDLLPPKSYPKSLYISPGASISEIEKLVTTHNFQYPVVVKPEVGRMGLMFRKIDTIEDLQRYHAFMPVDYILQELIKYPIEVSVFYYRYPYEQKGNITGFVRKEFLAVTGDGKSTLAELINNYPRVRFILEEIRLKHQKSLQEIIPAGESFQLSYALNLSRGCRLVNLDHEKNERLLKLFDDLSHYTKTLFFGRYDIKCTSIEDLKQGKNFCILEYNGSGGEPHHVYGNGNTLLRACSILARHWGFSYKISKYNHAKGIRYWNFREGWKFFKVANKHIKLLKQLDAQFPAS
ncbi:MAG: hypothetical protein M3Q56_10770 [Bacteroidota bacterium]|nr:hypothetical protein [Bacteroidota bacterium]